MTRARVLVLGASGFIGRRVIKRLQGSDWAAPIAASRRTSQLPAFDGLEQRTFDATEPDALTRELSGVQAVVNCVAGDAETILAGGMALFSVAMRQTPPPRIVHMSSLAAYGSATGSIDESAPLLGDLGPYSAAKAAVEQLAKGTPTVVLRPGIVYGPRSAWWSDRIARLLCSRRLGDLGPRGSGFCNLVHVEDVASAVVNALRLEGIEGQCFNLASPTAPTWNEYFRLYAEALGVLPVREISERRLFIELNIISPILKMAEISARFGLLRTTAESPAIRPWLLQLCSHDIRLRVDEAQQRLRLSWTPLRQGLQETANWFLGGGRT